MTTIDFVFFDAGAGHRSAAEALQAVISENQYAWDVRLTNLQDLLGPLDFCHRLTGLRSQDVYNNMLKYEWTLASRPLNHVLRSIIRLSRSKAVQMMQQHWRKRPPHLVVSLIPHFNRILLASLRRVSPRIPLVTVLTDLADYPPHFWIEPQEQFYICGSQRAVAQARELGVRPSLILQTSGMIIHPRFYTPISVDRRAERHRLGLDPDRPTGLVMFGGYGSPTMLEIARRLDRSRLDIQLIFICGHNAALRDQLRTRSSRILWVVEGFTHEVPLFMHLADFFIGKPGPGSLSEALAKGLPAIVERNAWTLPQEQYNAQWIGERRLGIVVRSFRSIARAVATLLLPQNWQRFKANVAAERNTAVYEIPPLLGDILASHACPQADAA